MFKGRYNYKVLQYEMAFEDLPEAFDGFTITQISDIHCGSFDNPKKVQYGIDLINAQQSDAGILYWGFCKQHHRRAVALDRSIRAAHCPPREIFCYGQPRLWGLYVLALRSR